MKQLRMIWKNDGKEAEPLTLQEGFSVRTFSELENAMDQWLDLMQYGLSEKREDESYYHTAMTNFSKWYREDHCFFIVDGTKAVATITVLCDLEKKEGELHMVACDPAYRGRGLGTALSVLAARVLKEDGMQTADLTTDDWRIPAIKTYLRVGFQPDLSTEDFRLRWEKIMKQIKA